MHTMMLLSHHGYMTPPAWTIAKEMYALITDSSTIMSMVLFLLQGWNLATRAKVKTSRNVAAGIYRL